MIETKKKLFCKRDFIFIALVFLIALLSFLFLPREKGETVEISVNGKAVFSSPLGKAFEKKLDCGVTIKCDGESAYFLHSDCPDKVCIKTGKLSVTGQWAACLPNGTVLKIIGEDGSADTVS